MTSLTILGGGFAGVWAAMSAAAERKRLGNDNLAITLISKDPSLTIRPRLYEGAKEEMQVPLKPLMDEIKVNFLVAEADSIDRDKSVIQFSDKNTVNYGALVLATGSQLARPPIAGALENAFSIDTFDDTKRLDEQLATFSNNDTAIVVGASFTGLELATELRGRLGPAARIILIDPLDNAAVALGANTKAAIEEALADCHIETRFGARVEELHADGVTLDDGERIPSKAVILATGIEASPLTGALNGERDSHGRLKVMPDLKVIGAPNIFAAGDTAHAYADDENVTYMSCQHAMELGRFAGHNAVHDLMGLPTRPYRQEFYATCLDLGPWGAVFTTGWDRQVQKAQADGKAMKRQINTEWIYPPSPAIGEEEILKSVALPASPDN